MPDREKVIKGLEETEIMLKLAVDRGGEMAVMGAFKCYNHVSDAIALLKEQEAVMCPTDHDNELIRHVLITARQHVEECLNKARVRYGGETAEFLMFAKGIRDACWAIDELINTHNEGTEQNDE